MPALSLSFSASDQMWEHRFALLRREIDGGGAVNPAVPFELRLLPALRSELRVPHSQPLSEVWSVDAVDFRALRSVLTAAPVALDPALCRWMSVKGDGGSAARNALRMWEVRARWAGVRPLPPPSRHVYDWSDRIAAVRRVADREDERLWTAVAAVLGVMPATEAVGHWQPVGDASPAVAVAVLRSLVEQYPVNFPPVAACNYWVWREDAAPGELLGACLRILKGAAYARRIRPDPALGVPVDVLALIPAAAAAPDPLVVLWPAIRRHMPRRLRLPTADESELVAAVRLLRAIRAGIPVAFAGTRLDLPEDVAEVASAVTARRRDDRRQRKRAPPPMMSETD